MATLGLSFQLSANAARMAGGVDEAVKQLDRVGKAAEKTQRDVSVIKWASVANLASSAFSTISNAATSAAHSIASYAQNVAGALDATKDLADRIGMGVESLQALQMAAKLSGVNDVTSGIQKLSVAIGQAAESGNTQAFEKLGLNFQELQAMSPENQFKAVQQAISALPTPAQRAAAAVSIFGRAGVELLPLMEQNLAAIEERMRRLGAIVSEEQVSAIGDMNDALDMVRATFDGIIGQVVGNLAPVVTKIANTFLEFVEGYKSATGDGGTGIANAITEGLFAVIKSLAEVVDKAIAGFNQIAQNFDAISNALQGMFNSSVLGVAARAARTVAGVTPQPSSTPASDIVDSAVEAYRQSQTPEAQAARDEKQRQREADPAEQDKKAAEQAQKAAQEQADFDLQMYAARRANEQAIEEANRKQEEANRKAKEKKDKEVAAVEEKMAGKQADIDAITGERAAALNSKSNEALKANDLRSSEGMAQFIALATGRQDPAIEEYRKQNQKLEQIRTELRALQQDKVDILMGAA